MDLADLTRDLEALQAEALAADRGRARRGGARRAGARRPGQEGPPDRRPARHRRRCPPRTARKVGAIANAVRVAIEAALAERGAALRGSELAARLAAETVDVTTPGRPIRRGTLHPINETIAEIADIFGQFGFVVYEGPEIEDDVRNFQMLNIPPDHPARDLWDTLYVDVEGHLLRTHTSPGPDPGDAPGGAADPGAAAGPLLPLRGDRRQPRLRVLPGRGPDGRRGHDDGRPQGPARPVRQGDVRRRQADPLPPGLLPVHRAVGRVRRRVPRLRRRRAARPARGAAG